ncbi:helix-turn-helix family protein [Carnobacterium maltaromaticum LMA28]|uniref:Helix-turn-helix family protein n=1 Tax=Carnobacterium maltaromaticum LMA28 TaxID=1234679 RepID=K8E4T8_CARML|nr:helix-turn-helix transcriptional regulator [Carnobacterium maltaromaticum]CCO11612.2 helix-turn-helix family protein [Carnobacterium maltaromaticum LMA28]
MRTGERIKNTRKKQGLTQKQLADKVHLTAQVISNIERSYTTASSDDLARIADVLNTTPNYLLGKEENSNNYYELTNKDEKDIAERLQVMIKDLENNAHYSKENGEMDDNTRELLIMSLENSLRIAKQEAKKKFTPKKYRN